MKNWQMIGFIGLLLSGCTVSETEKRPLRYLALGDSYTIGEGVVESERWPMQLQRALQLGQQAEVSVEIVAKTGWTTAELMVGIEQAQLSPPYDLVTLLIGVNDQYRGVAQDAYRKRFEQLVEQAIASAGGDETKVIIVSIPDYGVTPFGQRKGAQQIAHEIDLFNGINQEVAAAYQLIYVDVTEISRAEINLLAADQLHPSGEMYQLWSRKILPLAEGILRDGE